MKNIMAGRGSGGGSGSRCTINIDCGVPYTKSCSGGTITVTPRCYANPGTTTKTCHVAGCPS